jgi:tetratricopeptide (TPR) repeat protein
MWSTGHHGTLAERLLPATVLLATLIGGPVAAIAQQFSTDNTAVAPTRPDAADANSQIPPEEIGDARLVEHRYQEAIESYQKAPSDSPDVWDKMGIAYQMLFDLKDAARCYRESLRLRPLDARAQSNLATVYDSLKDYPKAERIYRKALKLDPKSAVIALNLGTNLMVQNKYDQGLDMYKRALALNPQVLDEREYPVMDNPMTAEQTGAINYYKAKGFAQAGMTDNAIRYLRRALNEGFTSPGKIAGDSAFAPLHGNPAFENMIAGRAGQ